MGKSRVRRLERWAAGKLDWFRLKNGNVYFFNPEQTALRLARFAFDVLGTTGDEVVPEPPILQKIRDAADRDAVIRQIEGADTDPGKDFVQLRVLVDAPQTHEDGP